MTAGVPEPALPDAALLEEAARKSALLWLTPPDKPARPAWHVWTSGAVHVVGAGPGAQEEQPLPDLAATDRVLVTLRSKDKGVRLLTFTARPTRLDPGSPEWAAAAKDLAASRLNAHDASGLVQRWAEGAHIWRLDPTGEVTERPGAMSSDAHAAPPLPTPATTRGPLPYVLGRRRRRRPG